MARVLVTSPTYFPIVGGAELLIHDVLTLLSRGHDVRLVTPRLPESSRPFWDGDDVMARERPSYEVAWFDDRHDMLDVRGHRVTRGLIPPMSLSAVSALGAHVRQFKPDQLVTFFGIPLGLPSLLIRALHGLPLTMVLCGTDLPSPRTAQVPLWKNYLRATTSGADRAVYVSRFCFDALEQREFNPDHDRVIHGGVPTDLVATADPGRVRRDLGLDDDELLLFCLSRIGPEKRIDVVVRAFASLRRQGCRARLVIGGQGSELPSLKVLAQELGVGDEVVFAGQLGPEKVDYYAACDIFVFHSMFETFGQVLAEAMMCGKPIVTSRAGAIPEVVDDGVTGLLVEPEDAGAFASAILQLAGNEWLRLKMGNAGKRKARVCFDWPSRAAEWLDALRLPAQPPPEARAIVEIRNRSRQSRGQLGCERE
jgi:glycosyltransferase involved in cell wall biosynthesis